MFDWLIIYASYSINEFVYVETVYFKSNSNLKNRPKHYFECITAHLTLSMNWGSAISLSAHFCRMCGYCNQRRWTNTLSISVLSAPAVSLSDLSENTPEPQVTPSESYRIYEHSGLSKKPAPHVHLWDFRHRFPALIDCVSAEVMRPCEPSAEHCTSLFLRRDRSFRPVKLYGERPETDFSNKAFSYGRESEIEEQHKSFAGTARKMRVRLPFRVAAGGREIPYALANPQRAWTLCTWTSQLDESNQERSSSSIEDLEQHFLGSYLVSFVFCV